MRFCGGARYPDEGTKPVLLRFPIRPPRPPKRRKSWCDGPRPKYFGPLYVGKAITAQAIPNERERGPEWIGRRIPYRDV